MTDYNILILGVGNILLSDESAGIKIIEDLQNRYSLPSEVSVVDGGTMGLEILPFFEGRTHLIIVDAAASGRNPGDFFRKELTDPLQFFRTRISPHQLGLSDVLAASALTGDLPGSVVLYGIEPRDLHACLELSEPVAASISQVTDLIATELKEMGLAITLQ